MNNYLLAAGSRSRPASATFSIRQFASRPFTRAESETYRDGKHKVKMEWGNDKQFAVRDVNFQSYNAEKAYSGMRLAGFSKAPDSEDGSPITAIVTFTETGGSNITMPAAGEA